MPFERRQREKKRKQDYDEVRGVGDDRNVKLRWL